MAVIAIVAILFLFQRQRPSVPAEGSQGYEQVTRVFYRGLAALEVGLLDNARQDFTQTTQLAADEPAGWADLGLTHLRLGELDAAAEPIMRALALAPRNADLELLAARMETARGRIDEGITHLRRAVALDSNALRPRYALAQQLEESGTVDGEAEALRLLDDPVMRAAFNVVISLERARLAAKRADTERLDDAVRSLRTDAGDFPLIAPPAFIWPPIAREQLAALQRAAGARDFAEAARTTVLLRNVLLRVPTFREHLAQVAAPAELVAAPIDRFISMRPAEATPSPADTGLTFSRAPLSSVAGGAMVVVYSRDASGALSTFAFDPRQVRGAVALDWNHDLRTDMLLAGPRGVTLLLQSENGTFADATAKASGGVQVTCDCSGAWAADIDLDGDLDAVIGVMNGPPFILRNNGDGTWQIRHMFLTVSSVRAFGWADLDGDGDPDAAILDGAGRVHVFINHQGGDLTGDPLADRAVAFAGAAASFTIADVDADGRLDIVILDTTGSVRALSIGREERTLAGGFVAERLMAADLDNNGAIDLIASGSGRSRVWLAGENHAFTALAREVDADVFAVADMNGDGVLDLIGRAGDQAVVLSGQSAKRYHWTTFRARAQERAGDQRINSFGVGGDIEVRAGLLAQKQLLTGMPLHFGLGTQTTVDVARIVWPNGVPQVEFNVRVDEAIVAEQRLKGSCPWLFAFDGQRMAFVTDFLWRSPLGLRINAQDTAGIGQTEDWVRIRGDQLAPRNGTYDLRITAELWETHFFDLVSLLVVDHPADAEVFVDERFLAGHPQKLAVQAVRNMRPVPRASDDRGRDVTDLIAHRDGRYLSGFALGAYQGIAEDHFVEIDLGESRQAVGLKPDPTKNGGADPTKNREPETTDGSTILIASGWVYPTDSSINLAIAQNSVRPRGVALEAQDVHGQWRVVEKDLGFPAGKNKTMVIDLDGIGDARRLRLRTNLEVYWDSLTLGTVSTESVSTMRIGASSAELRYRGFSRTRSPRGESPETPDYTQLDNTSPRWRDLTGYYTRFGDVRELVERVDDRYVIMNAGDELRLQFSAAAPPRPGWRRDFVLIGDGWEKDGDYNTGYSSTVLPLPTHASTTYEAASRSLELEDDPVYQQHRDDWTRFHTRYVSADGFLRGLFGQ